MNILSGLIRRAGDPIALDASSQSKFDSWEAGFDAHEAGLPIENCVSLAGRSRPLYRDGWNAARRIDELIAEQAGSTGDL